MAIDDLARHGARVQSKVNARGEFVTGVIIPPRTPGEWSSAASDRDAKRLAREGRGSVRNRFPAERSAEAIGYAAGRITVCTADDRPVDSGGIREAGLGQDPSGD